MRSEKMREEFEMAYLKDVSERYCGCEIDDDEWVARSSNGEYQSFRAAGAWWAWQASREALEQSTVSPEVQAMLSFFEAGEAEEIRMAEAYVRESERCSISALQRKFKIGYNRACRLMERLVALKVVSPIDAEGRRTVLPEQVKP